MTRKPVPIATAGCARGGFTLAELLVSIFVLAVILLVVAQLMISATAITRTGNKHVDTDTQARVVLDRMALDFGQMVKRTDVDYYIKQRSGYNGHGNGHGWGQGHNGDLGSDQIAFFCQVPGYYPSGVQYPTSTQSPISLVAYRVDEGNPNNTSYGRLQRMAKGLLWNGMDTQTNQNGKYPIVFLPQTISLVTPWAAAVANNCSGNNSGCDSDYEVIGPGVFRFEYYYQLKNGRVTDWPWDRFVLPNQITITNPTNIGLSQVESIAVAIAVIDPAARALIQAAAANAAYGDILDVAADLPDFRSARGRGVGGQRIGDLEVGWKGVVESIAQTGQTPSGRLIPPEAAKGIRIYNRYFDLKSL
jgi:prepilin-type N-terminal cleavage/methylation domain-containing protein